MKQLLAGAIFCGIALISNNIFAQKCATHELLEQKLNSDPVYKEAYIKRNEQALKEFSILAAQKDASTANLYKTTANPTVPVVFHIVLNTSQINQIKGTEGIYKRVQKQLEVLNRDFNAKNADISTVPTAFQSLIGSMNVTFALAHRDPNGKATSGIEIKILDASIDGFNVMDGQERNSAGNGLEAWDENKYLNIWVDNIKGGSSGQILGYAISKTLAPGFMAAGVTLTYGAFGAKTANADGYFITNIDSGRTLVHEMGHFFNLDHIWGGSNVTCTDDDGIDDTPKQSTQTYGCPTFPKTDDCATTSPGIMFMNYMDYSDDKCLKMFTKKQVTKMQAELNGGTKVLTEHPDLTLWPTGVTELETSAAISVSPNPTNGPLSINFNNTANLKGITIVNLVGKVVKDIPATSADLYNVDLSDVAKGMYLVHCRFEEGTVTRKIVLQ